MNNTKRWISLLAALALLLTMLPVAVALASSSGLVRDDLGKDSIDVYMSKQASDDQLLGGLTAGTRVTIYRTEDEWLVIDFGGMEGYVKKSEIIPASSTEESAVISDPGQSDTIKPQPTAASDVISPNATEMPATDIPAELRLTEAEINALDASSKSAQSATVSTAASSIRAPLYREATTASTILGWYANGTKVTVLRRETVWSIVQMPDGVRGFMLNNVLSFANASVTEIAYVNNPSASQWLNLRESPNTTSRVLGQFYNGAMVTVYERGVTWSRVEVNGLFGYMMSAYLRFTGTTPTPTAPPSTSVTYAVVNNANPNSKLNLRASASTNSAILGQYSNGTTVQVLEYTTSWCRVQVGMLTGYMMTSYLRFDTVNPTPTTPSDTVVAFAYVNNPKPNERLNLRAQASASSQSLGQYYNGTVVKIYQYGPVWSRVEVMGQVGYMMTAYLSSTTDAVVEHVAYINNPIPSQGLHLRQYPIQTSQSLGVYYNGTLVRIIAQESESWVRVEVDAKQGYMMSQYLVFSKSDVITEDEDGQAALVTALTRQEQPLYAEARDSSSQVGKYAAGTQVEILEYEEDWSRVRVNGQEGYMPTPNLQVQ